MTAPRSSSDPRYKGNQRTRAAELYAELGSVRAVAEEMGVSVRRAWEYLSEAGVDMRPPGRPKKEP